MCRYRLQQYTIILSGYEDQYSKESDSFVDLNKLF